MIKDRIKELRRVKASDLIANPKNWREHPDSQRTALQGVLDEVGWADAVLARETKKGLVLIDGHLRKEIDDDAEIPVLVLDVTEEEANLILASHDPLSSMAISNDSMLQELIAEIDSNNVHVNDLLESLTSLPLPPDADGKEFDEMCVDDVIYIQCPECGHEFPK